MLFIVLFLLTSYVCVCPLLPFSWQDISNQLILVPPTLPNDAIMEGNRANYMLIIKSNFIFKYTVISSSVNRIFL